jgi:TolB-like protein
VSDVFISYARSTEVAAMRITEALRAASYDVWRDDELPAHRSYADVIAERLRAARAVVVIWSVDAVKSEWVQSEADRARQDHKLVQLSIDAAPLPMPFDRFPCADLSDWSGVADHAGWRKVLASLADLVGRDPPSEAPRRAANLSPPTAEPSLAVLAFDNLSGDPDLGYFSDGVSAEILQAVARAAGLKVIARSSSFQFRGPDKSARHVAGELKVTHILDGSVRRSGAKVRIATELIRCDDEATLWSERFDRDLADVFAAQEEIAAAVAVALKVAFTPGRSAGALDAAAYELFLKTLALPADNRELRESIQLLEQLTKLAPDFAPAWARLAFHRANRAVFGERSEPFAQARDAAKEAAETALRLDPRSSVAWFALSQLRPLGRYGEREQLLRRALDAAPNDAFCYAAFSQHLNQVGRTREALLTMRRGYELDPMFPETVFELAQCLFRAGAYEDAQRLNAEGRRRWPTIPGFYFAPATFAAEAQDWELYDHIVEAGAEMRASAAGQQQWRNRLSFSEALRGRNPGYASGLLKSLEDQLARYGSPNLLGVVALFKVGLSEEAFGLAEQADYRALFDEGARDLVGPGVLFEDSLTPRISRDPRFVALCAKLGLSAYWITTDRWPDCAAGTPYDFRAEARRLISAA